MKILDAKVEVKGKPQTVPSLSAAVYKRFYDTLVEGSLDDALKAAIAQDRQERG